MSDIEAAKQELLDKLKELGHTPADKWKGSRILGVKCTVCGWKAFTDGRNRYGPALGRECEVKNAKR